MIDLLTRLLKVIEAGDAPAIGELNTNNLVDDYYLRLVEIINQEAFRLQEDARNLSPLDDDSLACVLGYDGPIY